MDKNTLKVKKIINVVDRGVTFPLRCVLNNDKEVYVKYQNNPVGTITLINEFIGFNISKEMDLTVPNFGVCQLDNSCILEYKDINVISKENAGLSFCTESILDGIVFNKYINNNINKEFEKILLIDFLLNNNDRHKGNIIYSLNSKKVYFIDFSHIIVNDKRTLYKINFDIDVSKDYIVNDSIIVKNTIDGVNIYDELNDKMGFSKKKIYSEANLLKERINIKYLDNLRNSIPSQWITKNSKSIIDDYFIIIKERLKYIDDIIKIYYKNRKERR